MKMHRFFYAALSGIVGMSLCTGLEPLTDASMSLTCNRVVCSGAQSVLFAKCFAELLTATIRGSGLMLVHWESYLVFIGMVSQAGEQCSCVSAALIVCRFGRSDLVYLPSNQVAQCRASSV